MNDVGARKSSPLAVTGEGEEGGERLELLEHVTCSTLNRSGTCNMFQKVNVSVKVPCAGYSSCINQQEL